MIARRSASLFLFLGCSFLILFLGCIGSVKNIDMENDRGKAVMGLDYRDFKRAAGEVIDSMLESGVLDRPEGGRYVLVISRVVNDTMQRIDTDQLIKKIRVELLNRGKIIVTEGVGPAGPEDKMIMEARKLRASDEFKQKTVAEKGQIIAPDLSLSGKIIQRNIRLNKKKQQVEYYFQLTLTDIDTGLALWEGESVMGKRGSNRSVSW